MKTDSYSKIDLQCRNSFIQVHSNVAVFLRSLSNYDLHLSLRRVIPKEVTLIETFSKKKKKKKKKSEMV